MGFDAHPQAEGPGPAQYALILALMAIAAVLALVFLSGTINTILRAIATSVRSLTRHLGTGGFGSIRWGCRGSRPFEGSRRGRQTPSIYY
jgi:Flp pilus assembly pilin Flp